jgi:hypothetical protein
MIELKIYVPKTRTWAAQEIHKGSGIVGQLEPLQPDTFRVKLDYQDVHNRNSNIQTWEDAVFYAAGRQLHTYPGGPPSLGVAGYPTRSRLWTSIEELIEVGVFRCDERWKYTIEITNQEALDAWRTYELPAKTT